MLKENIMKSIENRSREFHSKKLQRMLDGFSESPPGNRAEFFYEIRRFYTLAEVKVKEKVILYAIRSYPELVAWAMLRTADGKYQDLYGKHLDDQGYKKWDDDITSELLMSIGNNDIDVLITYVRLHIDSYSEKCSRISKNIEKKHNQIIQVRRTEACSTALKYAGLAFS